MKTQHLDLKTSDGSCDAYLAWPGSEQSYPAVLFYMDGFGPREALYAMVQKIAAHGYVVLMPNLFYRVRQAPLIEATFPITKEAMPEVFKQIQPLLNGYDPEQGVRDAQVFLNVLAERTEVRPGRIGIIGYCMGGGLALRTAARYPDRVAAAASFHGGRLATDAPNSPHRLAKDIKCRIYIAHADADASMPAADITRLQEAFQDAGVNFEEELYEGALHGFTMADLPVYNQAAAERHWQKLFALLDQELK